MLIQSIPIAELRPAPYNPRRPLRPGDPGWEKLRRSLSEFSLVQPIVWNRRTGCVVSGHQRLEILRSDGATHVDCAVVDLPLEREQALNLTLNNRSVGSDWDLDKLAPLLTELQELPDFDLSLTGFDDRELRDLIFDPAPADADPAAEQDADAPGDRVTAQLEVPTHAWDAVRRGLDRLLRDHPTAALHVLSKGGLSG